MRKRIYTKTNITSTKVISTKQPMKCDKRIKVLTNTKENVLHLGKY